MTDFLDTLVQQLNPNGAAPVVASNALPTVATGANVTGFLRQPVPANAITGINQNILEQFTKPAMAAQPLPNMIGQAGQIAAPQSQVASMIGTEPRVARAAIGTGNAAAGPGNAIVPYKAPVAAVAEAAPTALPSVAAAGTTNALEEAAAKGLSARMRSAFPSLAGATVTKGSIMKGGAAAVAGLVASGWIDARNLGGENSEMDQALKGGVLGAGLGAGAALTLGLGAGPVGWAALAGAGLFAAGNMVFGDNDSLDEKMDKSIATANGTIDTLINNPTFGIDPDTASQIKLQVAATTEFYRNANDLPGLQSYLASLAQTVPSFLMEASQRDQANKQKMQMQAAFGPVYSRMVDRSSNAAQQAFTVQMEAANAISDPQVAAAMKSQASQQYSAQMDTMAAYAQQIAAAPQNLPASQQAVVDNTSGLLQQVMGR